MSPAETRNQPSAGQIQAPTQHRALYAAARIAVNRGIIDNIIEGHGAIVRLWRFADATHCRAVSNPAGAGFSEKYHISPHQILRNSFDVVSLGRTLYPNMLHWKMSTL